MRTGDIKKDSVFSNFFNKFTKKDNNKGNNNVNVNLREVSHKGNNSQMTGNNNDVDLNNSSNAQNNNNSSGASKSLEIIKQKKMNRMSLIDVNSNLSKKLASDNLDYDPVFK